MFVCSIPVVDVSSARQAARPFVHSPTQMPLLHKLLSSFNLRELYLFIICSQAVQLWQSIVSRGNLSPSLPSFLPSLSYKAVVIAIVCRTVMFLHCFSEDGEIHSVVYSELRCTHCSPWWTMSPKIKPALINIF